MNNVPVKSDWEELKNKIKANFDKLSDESIESLKDNLDKMPEKLQTAYGYAKEQAEKEFATFKTSLNPIDDTSKKTLDADHKSSNEIG